MHYFELSVGSANKFMNMSPAPPFQSHNRDVLADSLLTGFSGATPPILVAGERFCSLHNSPMLHMNLTYEVVDVSFGGAIKMSNCSFNQVLLKQQNIVSTSYNDNSLCGHQNNYDSEYLAGKYHHRLLIYYASNWVST
jgi:hypothetical protein